MISAIVLAAGLSTRMESKNKLSLSFKGKTVIVTVVENIINAGIEEVIVVTGYDADQVQNLLKNLSVKIIYNNDFKKGMTTSIQKGILIAKGDGYMICLADMPFITTGEYLQLKSFFENKRQSNEACICVAEHKNKRGNPVIFSSFYQKEILTHTNMEGCKEIIQSNKQNVYHVEMDLANILKDIDTPDEYKQVVSES